MKMFLIIPGLIWLASCQSPHGGDLTVMKGSFRQSFTETGELAALKSSAITMNGIGYEYGYEFKIIEMVENGTRVKKGDSLVRLDDSSVQRFIISSSEALETERAMGHKLDAEISNATQALESELKTELARYDLKKLELERSKFDTEQKRKIKELEFKKATIRLEKLKRQLALKPRLNALDQRIQQIKIVQREADLKKAQQVLSFFVLTAPESGLFQVASSQYKYPPEDLKVGDDVWMESLVARIPDVEWMCVNTFINESDYTKIRVGSSVIVRLDALPKTPFSGTVAYINPTCTPKDKEMVFRVKVNLNDSDLRLKPGMTVSCEFISYEEDNALYAPNQCVLRENNKAYVFIAKGSSYRKTEVVAGRSNNMHTLISGEIKPGQKLIAFEEIQQNQTL